MVRPFGGIMLARTSNQALRKADPGTGLQGAGQTYPAFGVGDFVVFYISVTIQGTATC